MNKPDVVVAFAFSKEGQGNRDIAIHAGYLSNKYAVPIFTQKDVGKYLLGQQFCACACAEEKEGQYLSTFGMTSALSKAHKGWKRVYVVAAPCHIRRCARDLKKAGFEIIRDDYFKKSYRVSFWFNPEDPQIWTRSCLRWWLREIPLRLLPWWLYKKITKGGE